MKGSSILIVRPGALGDAVLTLPALHACRLAGAERLSILGTPASWEFPKPHACRIFDFASTLWLGLFNSGVALDARANEILRGMDAAIVYLSGDTTAVQSALENAGIRRILCAAPPRSGVSHAQHAARILLSPLQGWAGQEVCDRAMQPLRQNADEFLAPAEDEIFHAIDELQQRGASKLSRLVALHPGSGGRRKCWPAERFAGLAGELSQRGFIPLILFGPADDGVRKEFDSAMTLACIRLENRPLRELFAILTLCRAYVGNDSGMTHLAARACPALAIFGPTDPAIWAPLGRVRVLRAEDRELTSLSVRDALSAFESAAHETP